MVILQGHSKWLKSLPGSSVAGYSLLLCWRHYNTCWEIFVATKAVAVAIQGRCWQTQSCTVPSLEIKMGRQPQNWTSQDRAASIVKQMLERLQSSFLGKSALPRCPRTPVHLERLRKYVLNFLPFNWCQKSGPKKWYSGEITSSSPIFIYLLVLKVLLWNNIIDKLLWLEWEEDV